MSEQRIQECDKCNVPSKLLWYQMGQNRKINWVCEKCSEFAEFLRTSKK